MIECSSCHTLNAESEKLCLACGAQLALKKATLPTGAIRCPAGHPIDPSWKTCPYCENAVRGAAPFAGHTTRLEEVGSGASPPAHSATRLDAGATTPLPAVWERPPSAALPPPPPPPPPSEALRSTRLEEIAAPARGHRTVLQELPSPPPVPGAEIPSPPSQPSGGVASAGRLVAVLAAPELGPGGSVFPVRAGKTTVGSDRRSDIAIVGDSRVSGEHAVILVRDGIFHLADRLSTNGTWVNGLEVPANGTVKLHDRDRLRLGSSNFILLIIDSENIPVPAETGT